MTALVCGVMGMIVLPVVVMTLLYRWETGYWLWSDHEG